MFRKKADIDFKHLIAEDRCTWRNLIYNLRSLLETTNLRKN